MCAAAANPFFDCRRSTRLKVRETADDWLLFFSIYRWVDLRFFFAGHELLNGLIFGADLVPRAQYYRTGCASFDAN